MYDWLSFPVGVLRHLAAEKTIVAWRSKLARRDWYCLISIIYHHIDARFTAIEALEKVGNFLRCVSPIALGSTFSFSIALLSRLTLRLISTRYRRWHLSISHVAVLKDLNLAFKLLLLCSIEAEI